MITYLQREALDSLIGNIRQQYGHSNSLLPAAGLGGCGNCIGALEEGVTVKAVVCSDPVSSSTVLSGRDCFWSAEAEVCDGLEALNREGFDDVVSTGGSSFVTLEPRTVTSVSSIWSPYFTSCRLVSFNISTPNSFA
jgi:hypothetical protein